jgi:DNA polymerase
MKPDRDLILREMGLCPVWRLRAPATVAPAGQGASATTADAGQAQATAPAVVPAAAPSAVALLAATDWDELAATVAACRQCRLCEARKQAVLGVGDRNADWLFVGEGPGAEEDARGEPFVGQAGKLLDNMLAAIGLRRGEDVYIANAVKCRPPENRTPTPEETAICHPYLERQIELVRPRLIVALGRPAAQTLLQEDVKIGAARGKLHDYRGIPLIVSYHPAYLLRTPQDKARAWEDLCFMRRTMRTQKDL